MAQTTYCHMSLADQADRNHISLSSYHGYHKAKIDPDGEEINVFWLGNYSTDDWETPKREYTVKQIIMASLILKEHTAWHSLVSWNDIASLTYSTESVFIIGLLLGLGTILLYLYLSMGTWDFSIIDTLHSYPFTMETNNN